jgi:hypothetical protein
VPIPRLDAYRSIKEGVVAPVDDDSVPFWWTKQRRQF